MYVLSTKRLEVSGDVVFEESSSWNWKTQEEVKERAKNSPSKVSPSQKRDAKIQRRNETSPEASKNIKYERQGITPIPF